MKITARIKAFKAACTGARKIGLEILPSVHGPYLASRATGRIIGMSDDAKSLLYVKALQVSTERAAAGRAYMLRYLAAQIIGAGADACRRSA